MTRGNKKQYDVNSDGSKMKTGNGIDFENQLDEWYYNNKVVSKLITDKAPEKTGLAENEVEDEINPEWEKQNLRYGWGKWTPDCLQVFNTIRWYVFWVCIFSVFQGFIVNGVINAIITTLEKRFDLPSSQSGLIASSNDFLAFFLVLVISFYGSERHKPKLIGIGVIVLGLGSFIFSLPHFPPDLYDYGGSDLDAFENVCRPNNGSSDCVKPEEGSSSQSYLFVFMLANALHGAGSTPMFTLGTSFIDENSKAEQTPFFLGIIYCVAALGVAAGYMGGGQFLNIYTDADTVDVSKLDITPMDPRWVGAWWIPFLISGAVMFIIAVPILGYPKRLPGSLAIQQQRKSEATKTGADDTQQEKNFGKNWKQFPRAMFNLIRNPTFLFLSLSACTEGMIISGIATFGAKFLQEKFNLPAAFASFVMGIITVPGAGGGMLLGGFIVKKRKLKCRGIIRMNMIAAFLGLLVGSVFWLQCPTQSIAGVTTEYVTGNSYSGPVTIDHQCNVECACASGSYEPVCGMDMSIYFTPCHAGCNGDFVFMEGPMGPFKMYTNCSCVAASLMNMMNQTVRNQVSMTTPVTTVVSMTTEDVSQNETGPPIGAFQSICMSDCKLLYVVAPLLFVGMLVTFMTCSPTQTATMRCVQGHQRSLAIGFQWLFLRLLGTTPGPLMLGSIMDSACHVWQDICGATGSCWIYEKTSMGVKLFVWWIIVKLVSLSFYFAAQYFYKAPDEDSEMETDESKSGTGEAEHEEKEILTFLEEVECKESVI